MIWFSTGLLNRSVLCLKCAVILESMFYGLHRVYRFSVPVTKNGVTKEVWIS